MQKLFVFFLWVCIAKCALHSEKNQTTESFCDNWLLLLDPTSLPTLEYICLKKTSEGNASIELIPTTYQVDQIVDSDWEKTGPTIENAYQLSTIRSSLISEWLLGEYFDQIDLQWINQPFLKDKSAIFAVYLEKERQAEMIELALLNQQFEGRNLTYSSSPYAPIKDSKLGKKKPFTEDTEEGFTQFALYLIIGGGICVIYSVLSPSGGSKKTPSKKKIELARRKRWLEKVFERGWIDRPTYHFLLKKIETLPEWLGGIKPLKQTEEEDYSSDTSVDLSKRKSGESVVKTKDTSLDNTSR
jgi:hypothetical protein